MATATGTATRTPHARAAVALVNADLGVPGDWAEALELEAIQALRTLPAAQREQALAGVMGLRALTWPTEDRGEAESRVREVLAIADTEAAPDWPEPQPIPRGLPDVHRLDPGLLPPRLRPWVEDIADRMQAPLDYPAVAAITALGSVVGRQCAIRPKRVDDWTVVPNLWAVIVGRPGVLKTPAVQEAIRPLQRLEAREKEAHDAAIQEWGAAQEVQTVAAKVRRDRIKKSLKAGRSAAALAEELAEEQADAAEPLRRRFLVNDATVEKLGEILHANPNGVLQFRDELSGWLRGMERQGRESDRGFYLEAWNGTGRHTYDRIGRGTLDIEAACVSLLGTIQPEPLRTYLTTGAGGADDGLVQRLQLAVWPDIPGDWRNVDRAPDREAREQAFGLFQELASLDATAIRAEREDGPHNDAIPFLRFDEAAQDTFDQWRAGLEDRVRGGREHPAIESHLSKYRSLVPSLALLYHLASGSTGSRVGEAAALTGIGWVAYLESHARRIYAPVAGTDIAPAEALAHRLQEGALEDGFSLRDVYRPQWSGLASREDAERAVGDLVGLDWLRVEEQATGGRARTVHRINPRLKGGR